MAHAAFVVESPLTPAEAFDRVADLTRVSEWDEGVQNAKQVTGSSPALGARYEVTVRGFDGGPATMVYEIEEFERPDRFVMRGTGDDVIAFDVLVFEATESGCRLHYEADLELAHPSETITDEVLQKIFDKVAKVPEAGLANFLA